MPRLTPRRVRLGILAIGVLLLVLYDCSTDWVADGLYIYRVRLTSAVPIREAVAEVYGRLEWAEDAARSDAPEHSSDRYRVPPDALAGAPFEVEAWFSIRSGFRNSRVQATGLLVVAVLADGQRVAKAVELPDGRESREVTVALD